MLFFRKRTGIEQIENENAEAERLKQDALANIERTTQKAQKVNRLLKANGFTLIILKAMGGGNGH